MDCHAVNEVRTARRTAGHYNAYANDLCTRANSKLEVVIDGTLANPAARLKQHYVAFLPENESFKIIITIH